MSIFATLGGQTSSAPAVTTGTFTPTLTGSITAGTTTYNFRPGNYLKCGPLVLVYGVVNIVGATGTGNTVIGNLPFTIFNTGNLSAPIGPAFTSTVTFAGSNVAVTYQGIVNTATMIVQGYNSGGTSGPVQLSNVAQVYTFSLVYQTSS